MTTSTSERGACERAGLPRAIARDLPWLALSGGVAVAVYVTYLGAHPYPAFGAGLFFRIAEEVAAAGYGLPTRIGGYTAGGVPFAYPPLPFYLLAVLVDVVGVDPLAASRYLPGLLVLAGLPPYYYAAKALLGSVPKAGLATTLLAVTPTALRWHLSAGGVVRALAFAFVAVGLYAGVRLFAGDSEEGGRATAGGRWRARRGQPRSAWRPWSRARLRWLVLGGVAFGLTVLSHPIYAVFFGLSYLVLFWFLDRSLPGLAAGAAVAVGGVAVAAPWLAWVVDTHGVGVLAGAAGTHGGLGGGLHRLGAAFLAPLVPDAETPFYLAVYAGAAYLLYRREYLLPTWLVAAGYVVGKHRFLFVPGAMMVAVLVIDWAAPRAAASAGGFPRLARLRRFVGVATVAVVVVVATALGGLAAAGQLSTWHGSASQPAFVDGDDRAATAWVEGNTEPDATFVVLGDAAEWFPLWADRTVLIGHWGSEWEGAGEYRRQLALYRRVSTCEAERCLTRTLARAGVHPEYVYVPKGHYTVRGETYRAPPQLVDSMEATGRYEMVFENEGVAVFRVEPAVERTRAGETPSAVRSGTAVPGDG